MKLRVFRDRPREDSVKVVAHWQNVHLFLYHYGATVRWRRGRDWRHVQAYVKLRKPGHGRGFLAQICTWRTANGAFERVPLSKRYISFKALLANDRANREQARIPLPSVTLGE